MIPTYPTAAMVAAFLVGMLLSIECGRRFGRRRFAKDAEGAKRATGTVEAAVFGLFGLLVAFSFSGAATRFDGRRHLVVEEANDISTAWLRLDLLPEATQPALRDLFRQYLDSRLETYRKLPDIAAAEAELAHSVKLQRDIWTRALAACRERGDAPTTSLVLPSLNAMFDITTTRIAATRMHPPSIIFIMLVGLALACSFLAGYGMAGAKSRSWTHMIAFAGITALSVYVIMDIEYPRLGLVRAESADRVLTELRETMKCCSEKKPSKDSMTNRESISQLNERLAESIIGQEQVIERRRMHQPNEITVRGW